MSLFENSLIVVEIHESEVPWLKIFTKRVRKEFSECSAQERVMLLEALDIVEREMLRYYRPEKINIASFGNVLPHVHWHIMARFKEDSYFPEPMWGTQQRTSTSLHLPSFECFCNEVKKRLEINL